MKNKILKLPIKFKEKWVNALRSGEYKQGAGALKLGDRYCCLGVAGQICNPRNIHLNSSGYLDSSFNNVPKMLQGSDDLQRPLSELNDSGVPFEVIAGVINEYL